MEQSNQTAGAAPIPPPALTLRSVGDLLTSTFDQLSTHLSTASFIVLPPAACFAMVAAFAFVYPRIDVTSALIEAIITLAGAVLSVFAAIGIMQEMKFGWTLSAPAAYQAARPYFWSIIWVSLLTMFIVVGGAVLLIIPGIIFGILLAFSRFAVVMDDARGLNALSFSQALVRDLWFAVFFRMLVMGIIIGVVSFIASKIPYVDILLPFFSIPFSIIYMVLLYNDLKAKKGITVSATAGKNRSFYITFIVIGAIAIPVILALIGYVLLSFAMMNAVPMGIGDVPMDLPLPM